MLGFNSGDLIVSYLKRHGFVGVGRVKSRAGMIRDAKVDGKLLLSSPLRGKNMNDNSSDALLSEYVCLVDWIKTVPRKSAKWRSSPKLYTTAHVRASLDGQQETVKFIEKEFGIRISELIA